MIKLIFGNGKIAVSSASNPEDGKENLLILESEKGTGTIGEVPLDRKKGTGLHFNDNGDWNDGIWFQFNNLESLNVVLSKLNRIKRQFKKDIGSGC